MKTDLKDFSFKHYRWCDINTYGVSRHSQDVKDAVEAAPSLKCTLQRAVTPAAEKGGWLPKQHS